ncbi:hypothetical protein NQZ79_g3349 [Umbelopsis isabellina]|nr:hypothetical protein NQZ79_g3349 [Umbelopsis isabellina]
MPQKVFFDSQGIKVAANLYIPEDQQQKKRAAIAIGHPAGGVKEQTAGLYAEKLNKLGFIALAFDAAYQEDFKSAVSYLSTLDQVDPARIGALGICASGGYVSCAAQTDVRIKAVAGVSTGDTGELWREGMQGSLAVEDLQKGLAEAAKERTREAQGHEPRVVNWVPTNEEDAKQLPERSLFREAYYYYRTPRAEHKNSPNLYIFRSLDKLAQYSAFTYVHLISPRPILLIAGSDADTLYMSENAIKHAKEPKELFVVDKASHVDLYDQLEYVDQAVEKLDEFYTKYLVSA